MMVPVSDRKIILVDYSAVKHHNSIIPHFDFTLKKGLCYHPRMPGLLQLLKLHDPTTLKIIADYWGIVESDISPEIVANEILNTMNNREGRKEFLESLSAENRFALDFLITHGRKESWAKYSRQFGEIRSMGASRIEREHPQFHPENATEYLWYRGLLGRMFVDQKPEPQEVAFIPDDLIIDSLIIPRNLNSTSIIVNENDITKIPVQSVDTLNDLTTILASARNGEEQHVSDFLFHKENLDWMLEILRLFGMLTDAGKIVPSKVKSWFDQTLGEMLASIIDTWYSSTEFNELHLIPEIKCEGSWKNDPKATRIFIWNTLLEYLECEWTPVDKLLEAIHKNNPDFQRPAGNYDLWLIRDLKSNEFLRGYQSWDLVEKRLLLFVVIKIMPALGLLELGTNINTKEKVFRWSKWGKNYVRGIIEEIKIGAPRNTIRSQGSIRLDSKASFPLRYQLSRFCEWVSLQEDIFEFRIRTSRVMSVLNSGMKSKHIFSILSQLFETAIPPTLLKAIADIEKNGCLIVGEQMNVLRVKNAKLLDEIKKSQASGFLGEPLNPTTVVIKPGMEKALENSLLALGYFSDFHLEV